MPFSFRVFEPIRGTDGRARPVLQYRTASQILPSVQYYEITAPAANSNCLPNKDHLTDFYYLVTYISPKSFKAICNPVLFEEVYEDDVCICEVFVCASFRDVIQVRFQGHSSLCTIHNFLGTSISFVC